jgi:hypothetical protein
MGWLEPKPLPPEAQAEAMAQRVAQALRTDAPQTALVALVRALLAEGFDEGEALGVLERARAQLRQEGREADEDAVLEVMDLLVGWCSPGARLRRDAPN